MKLSRAILIIALLFTFGVFSMSNVNMFAAAKEGKPLNDAEEAVVEDEVVEEGEPEPGTKGADSTAGDGMTGQDVDPDAVQAASDVQVTYHLVDHNDEELPAGEAVTCLISFRNAGENKHHYRVASIEASLRYPMDFSYYLQNYTSHVVNQTVDAERETTFAYRFKTSERFAGRPFGFVIEATYFDEEDKAYMHTVLNKTINFVEVDDAFDGEALMLYVMFGGILVVAGLMVYYYVVGPDSKSSWAKGKKASGDAVNGTETDKYGQVHDEWLPVHARKSPKTAKLRREAAAAKKTGGAKKN